MTRAQRWAKEALDKVLVRRGKKEESAYRTLCMKTPILLKQSGAVQALAFLRARDSDKSPGKEFSDDLAAVFGIRDGDAGLALLKRTQDASELSEYLALSRDLIEISMWFRRFAQSELTSADENDGETVANQGDTP